MNAKTTDSTAPHPKVAMTQLLDLPRELHVQIARQLFRMGLEIAQYASACRNLRLYLTPLLYQIKLVVAEESVGRKARSSSMDYVLSQRKDYSRMVNVLQIRSGRKSHRGNGLIETIPLFLPLCERLKCLYLTIDSIALLFQCVRNLPKNLRHLDLILTTRSKYVRKSQDFDTGIPLGTLPLETLSFKSPSFPITHRHLHPELTNWWRRRHEINFQYTTDRADVKERSWFNRECVSNAKTQVGELLHNLLSIAASTITSIVTRDLDLAMVFQDLRHGPRELRVVQFRCLKLLEFDSCTLLRLNGWYRHFVDLHQGRELVNGSEPLRVSPVMLMYDSLGGVVYHRECETSGLGELEEWRMLDLDVTEDVEFLKAMRKSLS